MREFCRLYIKELRESTNIAAIYGVLSIGWFLFLCVQKFNWHTELIFGLSFIPLGLLPVYLILKGYISFRSEWKDETIYAVLSLPVPGWYFSLSKLAAAMSIFTVLSLLSGLGVYIVSYRYIWSLMMTFPQSVGLGIIGKMFFLVYLLYWFISLVYYVLTQFSYLLSQLFTRFNGIISGLVFLLSNWLLFRLAAGLTNIMRWTPDILLKNWGHINGYFYIHNNYLETAPFFAILIVITGIFFLGSWVLENVLEV